MPIWKKLCKVKDKKVHMVSMEHSVYSETPLASKKSVSGVPTVIYVDPKGEIHEEDNIRDETVMTNAITNLPLTLTSSSVSASSFPPSSSAAFSASPSSASSFPPSSAPSAPSPSPSPSIEEPVMLRTSEITDEDVPVKSVKERAATPYPARNTNSESNSLPPLPATPIFTEPMSGGYREEQQRVSQTGQTGGDPWSAFLSVARQAAPAAALLAAYGMLPLKRASGLHAARKTNKTNKTNKTKRSNR